MEIGLVLSGGGIRGLAHFGVIKALTEKGIKITRISGTSAGSIAGALFANNVLPDDAMSLFNQLRFYKYLKIAFNKPALFNLENVSDFLKLSIPHNSFEALKIPLTITATNLNDGLLTYFSEGELIRKVLASSCIPGVFSPIMIDGDYYVDGGVLNNFPIEPLLGKCDYIIGSDCNHLPRVEEFKNLKQVLQRCSVLSVNRQTIEKQKAVNIMIQPKNLGTISTFQVSMADDIFWIAYDETLHHIDRIKADIKELKTKKGI